MSSLLLHLFFTPPHPHLAPEPRSWSSWLVFCPALNPVQLHLTHAAQLVLSTKRHLVDEQTVLEVLIKALTAATGGWVYYGSCQCLVRAVMVHFLMGCM